MDKKIIYGIITVSILGLIILWFIIPKLFNVIKTSFNNIFSNSITVNPKDVMTDGKFDVTKFNSMYVEIKKKKQDAAKKKAQERLTKLQELNKEDNTIKILDMKVYDMMIDYGANIYGITLDVINGEPWYKNNRVLYLGWTLVLISLVYFLLNNI
uniref:Uncharacterized protein n=1 Tax=viral metagenome TaxID=1070528 RepID=A0A6C0LZD2_9ZZZZ